MTSEFLWELELQNISMLIVALNFLCNLEKANLIVICNERQYEENKFLNSHVNRSKSTIESPTIHLFSI